MLKAKILLLFVLSVAVFQSSVPGASVPADKSVEALMAELIECLEAGLVAAQQAYTEAGEDPVKARAASMEQGAYSQALQAVRGWPLLIASGNMEELQRVLVRTQLPVSLTCATSLLDISKAVADEKAETERAFESEFESFKVKLGGALLSATKTSDLDSLFEELRDLNAQSSNLGRRSNSSNDLSNLSRIVSSWQEYLAYRDAGDTRKALSAINNITNSVAQTPIVPRSEIIERRLALEGLNSKAKEAERKPEPPTTVDAVMAQVRSLDQLGQIRPQLKELEGFAATRNDASNALRLVDELEIALNLIEQGSPLLSFGYINRQSHSAERFPWMANLKEKASAIALSASIPPAFLPEQGDPSSTVILLSAAEKMAAAGQWLKIWEMFQVVDEVYNRQASRFIPSIKNDIRAIETYLSAKSLEESGQLSKAFEAYNRVLGITGVYGPYGLAEEAIRSLRVDQEAALLADLEKEAKAPEREIRRSNSRADYLLRQMSDPALREALTPIVAELADQAAEEKIKTFLAAEKLKAAKAKEKAGVSE